MLEKIGKAKGTNDAEFQALWKRAEDHFELLDNIKKYMENYIRGTLRVVARVVVSCGLTRKTHTTQRSRPCVCKR